MSNLVIPLFLSGIGVAVAGFAFYNRDKPEVQRDMPKFMILAVGQVALGAVTWLLVTGTQ